MPQLTSQIEANGVALRFFFNKEGNKYYVQSSASAQLFEVQQWKAVQVLKRKKDFVAPK
jgi:hypothetical protein